MNRFWHLASGLAVFLMAASASVSLVLNLALGERPLLGIVYRVLLPAVTCIVIFLSFAGSYLLLKDARKSK
jgi:multisubunit Na+/H+ antiporter MnhB subunit